MYPLLLDTMHILGYEVLNKSNQVQNFNQQSLTIDQKYMLIGCTVNINQKNLSFFLFTICFVEFMAKN
jgi:hypothetical protein